MFGDVCRFVWEKKAETFFERKVNEEKNGFLSDVSSSERPLFNFFH